MNIAEIKRARAIADYLLGKINEEVSLNELSKLLNAKLVASVAPAGEEAYRKAALLLKNSNMCPRGFELHFSRKNGTVILEPSRTPSFLDREEEHPELKAGLGFALWHRLLHIRRLSSSERKSNQAPTRNTQEQEYTYSAIAPGRVATKIARLRDQPVLSVLVDAGSTTTAAVRALLDVDSIPIRPENNHHPNDKQKKEEERQQGDHAGQCRFITPVITTNALSIATMISESKHADTIGLRLIGGNFHSDLSSICGSMTDQCLCAWGGGGSWKSDLAIIGTTGCWGHPSGALGFACDNFEESRLKATLLEMAFFRVIIMDSSKLKASVRGNLFAPLSSTFIDLVVTDDGRTTGAEQEVSDLHNQAAQEGVATVILTTESSKAPGKKGAKAA